MFKIIYAVFVPKYKTLLVILYLKVKWRNNQLIIMFNTRKVSQLIFLRAVLQTKISKYFITFETHREKHI